MGARSSRLTATARAASITLFRVLNGELKTTKRKKKVVVLSFRGGLSNKQVADGIRQQAAEIANFIEYRQR